MRHRFVAAVEWPSEAASDHLEVEVWAVDRAGDDDGAGLGRVESLAEHAVVDERVDLAVAEAFDDAAAGGGVGRSADCSRGDSPAVEECCEGLCVLDGGGEDQRRPVRPDMVPVVGLEDAAGALNAVRDSVLHGLRQPGQQEFPPLGASHESPNLLPLFGA